MSLHTTTAAHSRPKVAACRQQAGDVCVGFVTVEFGAAGTPLSDGRLYEDREIATGVVTRRNELDGLDGVLERWYVFEARPGTPEAAYAVTVANKLRAGLEQRASR